MPTPLPVIDQPSDHHQSLSEMFTTWGHAKLLQHLDALNKIQTQRTFSPIHVQICPTETCESDCPFCSVGNRPYKSFMPWPMIQQSLQDFAELGVKAIEITGGGNPLLYQDKENNKNINDVIEFASSLGCDVGVITNAHDLSILDPQLYDSIDWLRVSLIKLDEGKEPEDYNFNGFPEDKLGFSYIAYEAGQGYRTKRQYEGTYDETMVKINKLLSLNPNARFARIAGNSIIPGYNKETKEKYKDLIENLNKKMFIKNIDSNDQPYNASCMIGMLRPFVAASPKGDGKYYVYICNSHVHNNHQTYNLDFAMCELSDIKTAWDKLNKNFQELGYPYSVRGNNGTNWISTCKVCCYAPNNELLHVISAEMPDKNFV